MKYAIPYVIIIILLITCFYQWKNPKIEIIETEIIKKDTVTLVDTLFIEKPVYKTKYITKVDTVYVNDTISIALPVETKIYEDSTYAAQISGINADLDWIKVYPKQTTIYEEKVVQIAQKQPLFEFKPSVGLGYGLINNKIDIYVGGSLQININRNGKH